MKFLVLENLGNFSYLQARLAYHSVMNANTRHKTRVRNKGLRGNMAVLTFLQTLWALESNQVTYGGAGDSCLGSRLHHSRETLSSEDANLRWEVTFCPRETDRSSASNSEEVCPPHQREALTLSSQAVHFTNTLK